MTRPPRRSGRPGRNRFLHVMWVLLALAAGRVDAVVLMTQEEALAEAFPNAEVRRLTTFLDDDQVARVVDLSGEELDSRVIIRYRGTRDDAVVGTAYFDAHLVRTLPETLMILVGADGVVSRIEVLSFEEPMDYLPQERWFAQFDGRVLDGELSMKRGIRGVTGATLTSRAVTAAVRRALALHRVLQDAAAPPLAADAREPEGEP